jgi:Trypsin-like peptidase domain
VIVELVEVYEAVVPSLVAIISRFAKSAPGKTPLLPPIIGTGFLVSDEGIVATNRHVADVMHQLPSNPNTGKQGYAAVMFEMIKQGSGGVYMRWMMHDVAAVGMLDNFSSDSQWFGEAIPDMAFAQLKVRSTPNLKLADDEYYIRPGTHIATAGFPLGDLRMTIMKKVNQAAPFIRRGIVSSVFPFSIPKPHGFTIDIMQQGGSSGSPIFYENEPTAVGMMASGIRDIVSAEGEDAILKVATNTNISIAIPSHVIKLALPTFLESPYHVDSSQFPTLDQWKASYPPKPDLGWDQFHM